MVSKYRKDLYPKLVEDCNITPEQWRSLTVLSASKPQNLDTLSELIKQPLKELQESVADMQEGGLITIDDGSGISLTDEGEKLQNRLFTLAKEHEAKMMKGLFQNSQLN